MRIKQSGILLAFNSQFEAIHMGYPKCLRSFTQREIWHGTGDVQSFSLFLKSKVSVLAQVYLIVLIFIVLFILNGFYSVAISMGLTFLLLNAAITLKLRNIKNFENFVVNCFLNFFYFIGRSLSPLYLLGDTIKAIRKN